MTNHNPSEPFQPFKDTDQENEQLDTRLREIFEKSKAIDVYGDSEDEFVVSLRKLRAALNIPEDATVIYPGSSNHVGVARVFGKDHVIHIDPEERAIASLQSEGYQSLAQTIEEYNPSQPADVMVALNSYGEPDNETITRLIKPGGWIITNNHTDWARAFSEYENLALKAAILPSYMDADARLLFDEEIPPDATSEVTLYFKITPTGTVTLGSAEDHTTTSKSTRYPDGLFVFQRIADKTA